MMGFDAIINFFIKKAVSTLVKKGIEQFHINGTSKIKIKLLISTLYDEIKLENKRENLNIQTKYSLENLYNFYKLAKSYEQLKSFSDMSNFIIEKLQYAVTELEVRLYTLENAEDKGTIYNYLADYYENKSYKKFEEYNLEALEYMDNLEIKRQAKIYARQALAEMYNQRNEDALKNIESAIEIEPYNNYFLRLEIEVLLKLKKTHNLLEQLNRILNKEKENKNILATVDTFILMAKFHEQQKLHIKALKNFKEAYKIIELFSDEILLSKKIYLLTRISLLEINKFDERIKNNEILKLADKSIELLNLKYFSYRHRLYFLEIAKLQHNKAIELYQNKQYSLALSLNKKVLEIKILSLGESHNSLAITYQNIAASLDCQGDYKEAILFYKESLKIRILNFENSYREIVVLNLLIGMVLYTEEEYDDSLEFFEKAYKISLLNSEKKKDQLMIINHFISLSWKKRVKEINIFNSLKKQ